ncbi:MAG: recombinase family protein [Anaerolineae bacterium]|nr:recombinase family protein [Anaerolineae bacterium]
MTEKRIAGYIRVSSEEQSEGWSLEAQERQIREYAERYAYQVVHVYQDETSGSSEMRPGFDQMLMDAHEGMFDAIVVVHTSRLFRNLALARRYKDLLRNKLNIDVIFVNQPITDPSDPTSFIMETVNEMFDEYYLHQLRFWTKLGKKARAQNGLWNGTLPFGYVTDENGLPVEHPTTADGVRLAFESYSTGRYSDQGIADLLNEAGYRTTGNWGERPFTKDTVNPMLKNVFYLGFVKYKDELYPGKHPPLIDQDLFDRCQEVRASRASKRKSFGQKSRVYVLAGIARCHECGLTLRCHSTLSGGEWRYYRHTAQARGFECSVPSKHLRADELEAQWSEIVAAIRLPDDWRRRIEELAGNVDEREAVLHERARVNEKLRRVKQLYKDLLIDDAEYRASRQALEMQLEALVLPSSEHLFEVGEYLENLGALWAEATLQEQQDITRLLLKAMYVDVLAGKIVRVEVKDVFRRLFGDKR